MCVWGGGGGGGCMGGSCVGVYIIYLQYTVEPPNKGHFGNGFFVLSSEVVPISEVHQSPYFKLLVSEIVM